MTPPPRHPCSTVAIATVQLADRAVAPRFDSVLPLGTLAVSVGGGEPAAFAAFGDETVRSAEEGADSYAVANVVIGVGASLCTTDLGAPRGQWGWS
ncbi:hypothetical protein D7D52_32730 [Nocardia yunnanensis]|uniref:Uncharacterized protein n=1 Tax=Nocardia yunnanensis TaxID=2382165 RepID=A0A386ZK26_9NOCA|nr:hypothetical protein D7D52_32730 [Nocardia yunnanensis]